MNADPDIHCVHLDLADLIGEITGQASDGQVQQHLADCEQCRVEAYRWIVVSDAVGGLVAAAPEVAGRAWLRDTPPPALIGRSRRAWSAASAAAALVLLGGAGYAVTAAVTGHAPGTGSPSGSTSRTGTRPTALTALNGCAGLEQASGTLERVNDSSLVIKTASGQAVTVTTTASTMLNVSGAPLKDITDGAPVRVAGSSSEGTIAAVKVVVGSLPSAPQKQHPVPPAPSGAVVVQGTVTDAGPAGFAVVTPGGTWVAVTISSDTHVILVQASLGELQAGATTFAVGSAGPDGTLSATAVLQPPGPSVKLAVAGCSPASIDRAMTTALVSGG